MFNTLIQPECILNNIKNLKKKTKRTFISKLRRKLEIFLKIKKLSTVY